MGTNLHKIAIVKLPFSQHDKLDCLSDFINIQMVAISKRPVINRFYPIGWNSLLITGSRLKRVQFITNIRLNETINFLERWMSNNLVTIMANKFLWMKLLIVSKTQQTMSPVSTWTRSITRKSSCVHPWGIQPLLVCLLGGGGVPHPILVRGVTPILSWPGTWTGGYPHPDLASDLDGGTSPLS